jgi:hypothetical protein
MADTTNPDFRALCEALTEGVELQAAIPMGERGHLCPELVAAYEAATTALDATSPPEDGVPG